MQSELDVICSGLYVPPSSSSSADVKVSCGLKVSKSDIFGPFRGTEVNDAVETWSETQTHFWI